MLLRQETNLGPTLVQAAGLSRLSTAGRSFSGFEHK
jgi:hypothetical protein